MAQKLEHSLQLIDISRVAKDVKELCLLVEAGFEYVTDVNGVKVPRKLK